MMGDNSKLTEKERKALFYHHMRKRMAHKAQIKEIQASMKEDAKLAQADGVVIGHLDFAMKALDADDKKTITENFIAEGEILTWLGLTPGFQADLLTDRAPAIERIENNGRNAGLAGKARESGYAAKSDEDKAWLRGYDDGQKIMRDNLEEAMNKANSKRMAEDDATPGDAEEKVPEDA